MLSVLKSNPHVDRPHLERWASELGVVDLLARALVEAGIEPTAEL